MSNYLVDASYGITNQELPDLVIVLNDTSENEEKYIEELNKIEMGSCNILLILIGNKGIYIPFKQTIFNEYIKKKYSIIKFYNDGNKFLNDNWKKDIKSLNLSKNKNVNFIYIV